MGEEKGDDAGVRKEEDDEEEDNAPEGTKMWNSCQQVSSIFLYSKLTWIPSHLARMTTDMEAKEMVMVADRNGNEFISLEVVVGGFGAYTCSLVINVYNIFLRCIICK